MADNKTNSFEEEVLKLIFHNQNIAGIGDATGIRNSTAAGNLFVALFTSDPTESGNVTGEANYTGYARQSVARTVGAWNFNSSGSVRSMSNAANITFPLCTGGSNTITHAGICKAGTAGVADLIIHGPIVGAGLAVTSGVQPQFAIGNLVFEEK